MHSIIAAVVGAEDREDALSEAEYTFELLCGEQSRIYDYYELFPDHETKSDETDRLENMPRIACLADNDGWQFLLRLWQAQVDEFLNNMRKLRKVLARASDWQIMEEGGDGPRDMDLYVSRYRMRQLSGFDGTLIKLYTSGGEAVRTARDLNDLIWGDKQKWASSKARKLQSTFIIPADVHS